MADYKLVAGSGSVNFSAPSFHRWAFHYYKCVQDFQSPDRWSPVPYALLCRAIELELKSRHLELTPGQRNVKEKFSHDLQKLYEALPADQRVLTGTELEVLRTASQVYNDDKAFDYIRPEDALTAYKRFPDQVELDAVAKKLLAL